ncbi:MAG: DNA-3-methyladenine glycosylase 2 family protein [Chloroflexi bacterium]|nr:DNA-3-methyladenine glycosylase 2 family protein [Chloroflexota bacterium]
MRRLTPESYRLGLQELAAREPVFVRILQQYGSPPLWDRPEGFPTLIHIILEQQVSLASAAAAFRKLQEQVVPLTPQGFLELDDATLKAIGFSRQKTTYGRCLAAAVLDKKLDLDALNTMEPADVQHMLTSVKGIGVWTADIYLLMVLLHADVWPRGDLALAKAVQKGLNLTELPDTSCLEEMSGAWRPWRAIAARLFWFDYLDGKE